MLAYPFTAILEVMKPCKPKDDDPKHVEKKEEAFHSSLYVLEEKIDGMHGLSIGGRIYSTRVSKKTGLPPEKSQVIAHISGPLRDYSDTLILDGEIYYPGAKSSDVTGITNASDAEGVSRQVDGTLARRFPADELPEHVVNREKPLNPGYLRYVVFDILRDIDGTWLVTETFEKRRAILEERMQDLDHIECLDLNRIYTENKGTQLKSILKRGGEGAILKYIHGQYQPGKRPMWNQIKIKQEMVDDVIVLGFKSPKKLYTGKNLEEWTFWVDELPVTEAYFHGWVGAIEIGKYDEKGDLVPLGTVAGLTKEQQREFATNGDLYIGKVARIRGMEMTPAGVYRHAFFDSWHPDKNPEECKLEENT